MKRLRARWERTPLIGRWSITIGGLIVGLNIMGFVIDDVAGGRRVGPPSSSFATDETGLAAYVELLGRHGRQVARSGLPPSAADLDPAATAFVLDAPDIASAEIAALRRFVDAGGRLVMGGSDPTTWFGLIEHLPDWGDGSSVATLRPIVPAPEVRGVATVASAGRGVWSDPAGLLPLLGEPDAPAVGVASPGRGRLVLMADSSPLQNSYIARADNAAFALAVAGPRERPVVFMESFHGYAEASGIRAIPLRWRWGLALMTLAGLFWIAAHARRLGPPDETARPLPPPRRDFVEALATSLGRSKRKDEAIQPILDRGRELLRLRLGLEPDANDDAISRAAQGSGLHEKEAALLLRPIRTDEDVLLAGQAMITLTGGRT